MITVDQPKLVEDNDAVDAFVCHIYDLLSNEITKCGIHIDNDKHKQMHLEHGHAKWIWRQKRTECPICQAPMCPDCLKLCGASKENA